MKMIALAAALLVGTAAIAQTTTEPPATPPADAMAPTAPAAPSDTMAPPAPAEAAPPAADPAMAAAAPAAPAAPAAETPVAQANYPRCSATVTDQCRQNSARESDRKGGPRKRRG